MGRRKNGRIDREIELLAREVVDDIIGSNLRSDRLVWVAPDRVKVLVEKVMPQQARRENFKNRLRGLLYLHGWSPGPNLSMYERSSTRYSQPAGAAPPSTSVQESHRRGAPENMPATASKGERPLQTLPRANRRNGAR